MTSISTFVEKEGYLWVKRHPSVKQLKTWQWKYVVLKKCSGYKYGACLEWYESRDAFLAHSTPKNLKFDSIKFVRYLEDKKKEFAFIVFVNNHDQLQLATKTEIERAEWTRTLNQFNQQPSSSASSDTTKFDQFMKKFPRPTSTSRPDVARTTYPVKFQDSTLRPAPLKMKADYLLIVGPKNVILSTNGAKEPQRDVLSWSLAAIKSYYSRPIDGNPTMKFLTIEAGRQSSTGSGDFHFLTPFGDEIVDHIRLNTKKTLKEIKKSSIDVSFDSPYSSSPEGASPRFSSSPKVPIGHMSPRLSVKSRNRLRTSFEKYDAPPETNGDSFGTYIRHENGYIHVLTSQEDVDKFKERKNSRPSTEHDSTSSYEDKSTYVPILGDDEPIDQSHDDVSSNRSRGPRSVECDEAVYIDVLADNETRERAPGDSGVHGIRNEVRASKESETQFYLDMSGGTTTSGTKRWCSQASHTSSLEYSSVSSENDVFQRERDPSIISDVFPEETEKIADEPDACPENNNNILECSQDSATSPLVALKDQSDDVSDAEKPTRGAHRGDDSKTNSWHSATGSEAADVSETHEDSPNTSSASDGGNVGDFQEFSEEDSEDTPRRRRSDSSPRCSSSGDVPPLERQRSFTTNDLPSLNKIEQFSPTLLEDLRNRMANPQDFFPTKSHLKLERTSPSMFSEDSLGLDIDFQNAIVDQLTNPTTAQHVHNRPRTHNAGEIKYLCTECGWYKRSRKKSIKKKGKKCERCHRLIQKSNSSTYQKDTKGPKSPKESRSTRLFSRITRKLTERSSVDTSEPIRDEFRPSKPPPPSFVKNLHHPVLVHNPALDSKRSEIGLPPSLFHTFHAVSISGESRTPPKSPPTSNENTTTTTKARLTSSKSEGTLTSSQISPQLAFKSTKSTSCAAAGEYAKASNPLTRTQSSPVSPVSVEAKEYPSELPTTDLRPSDEKLPRKLSGGNLPPLPEDTSFESIDPPAIPPRTREEPPPVPPRRNTGYSIRKSDSTKLRRAQTDPINCLGRSSPGPPMPQEKQRISRTLTDPGLNELVTNDRIRNAVSLGDLLENNEESKTGSKTTLITVKSQSLGNELDSPQESSPPPLPPRRGSGPAAPPPVSPRQKSTDVGKSNNPNDKFKTERPGFLESEELPENGSPGRPNEKRALVTTRSLEARRDFQTRNALFSTTVDDTEDLDPSQ